eukprot:TRINITY_DN5365_c0_g1_i1.p1 TRINITY_DN5365_c0_g1~~TRINITY_DN5365_c0_g1_i1.p1  ORF type:complete len:327 (-),score=59.58 TRINITY_DN5365_c0_g1_i1:96-1076(-)
MFRSLTKPTIKTFHSVKKCPRFKVRNLREVYKQVSKMTSNREVVKKIESREQSEGAGARVRRSIGRRELPNFDPFLMLDEFMVKKPAGFPDHPHRGFETVTYMLSGSFKHEDFCGHAGVINPGDLQWMTAGKGIVHSEIPMGDAPSHGLQLWVNLKSTNKMVAPKYQELLGKDIPKVEKDGVHVTVIAGSSMGIDSPVYTLTPTLYLDFTMQPNSSLDQEIPEGFNAFFYTLEGTAYYGAKETECGPHFTLVLSQGNRVQVKTKGEKARFVLIGGQPLNEPVVQHGPFVMNTQEEIQKAFLDFYTGQNGFERAKSWQSEAEQDEDY